MYGVLLTGASKKTHDIGGKAAGLNFLLQHGFPALPTGVITIDAFLHFLHEASVEPLIERLVAAADTETKKLLLTEIRSRISVQEISEWLFTALANLITDIPADRYCLRSSATVEDSSETSFAGVFESHINIPANDLVFRLRDCYASVFSEHALEYAQRSGISIKDIRMAAVIQPVAKPYASGVSFTCEPDTGCSNNVVIQSALGFGEAIVSGELAPDTFVVNKHTESIIKKSITTKQFKYRQGYSEKGGIIRDENDSLTARMPSLTDDNVRKLYHLVRNLELKYAIPADIEWVLTEDGYFIIVQIRPLVQTLSNENFVRYTLPNDLTDAPIIKGQPITDRIVVGKVRHALTKDIVASSEDVIVAKHIDVDWIGNLRNAKAVITEGGGYTSHIAIILREIGIPALFGAEGAFDTLEDGATVTVACNSRPGEAWLGALDYSETTYDLKNVYQPKTKVHLVSSSLAGIDKLFQLPLNGIGLVRLEFLISNAIGIHPMALADYVRGGDLPANVEEAIRNKSEGFSSAEEFYISTLTESICAFASRCPDKVVNVRFADLLTDDYLSLIGGNLYETQCEANPMLGWRGTTRLIDEDYRAAFILDCKAFQRAIDECGFTNINLLLPFCRMPEDVSMAIKLIRDYGPSQAKIGMMVEVPSNIALASEFENLVDLFLVGPMDMTQLTYGADRKAKKLSHYNNQTLATKEMVKIFLQRIPGCGKEVFIGGWPLFQYLSEYRQVQSNNILHLVELPDRMLELFENLRILEASISADEKALDQLLPPIASSW
ncbi:MAG: PEP/pyruvate-binding domain-containing protein [Sedimenticola sp.]